MTVIPKERSKSYHAKTHFRETASVCGPVVSTKYAASSSRSPTFLNLDHLAARWQGLAEPDTAIISAATRRLIAGFFDCRDLGLQTLKGMSAPAQLYCVLRESSVQSRLEADVSTGKLTPLVGRAHEVGLLLERWTAAQASDGQVVVLNGEPGIGKPRGGPLLHG